MKPLTCHDVRTSLDEHVRQELDRGTAGAITSHLAQCTSCDTEAAQAQQAFRALDSIRGEALLEGIDESRFHVLRARVLHEVARESQEATGFLGLRWAWGGAAAAACAIVLSFLGLAGVQQPAMVATTTVPDQAVNVVTIATKDGIRLHWSGDATTYVVLKSSRPSLEQAERTLVCGTDWIDRSSATGATFYRVVVAHEPCRT